VYTARAAEGEPRAGAEVSEVGWFSPDALPPMAFPHDQEIVARWAATRAGRR
jgi:ADP-ribose pyrophosphatase YjhB (NUDIX family)